MFRKQVMPLGELLRDYVRKEGLETPLLMKRAVDAWDAVCGASVAARTTEKFVRDQVLFVKISSPALRQDLSMRHTEVARRINALIGTSVLKDVRII